MPMAETRQYPPEGEILEATAFDPRQEAANGDESSTTR